MNAVLIVHTSNILTFKTVALHGKVHNLFLKFRFNNKNSQHVVCIKRTMLVGMNNEDTEPLTSHNKPPSTEISSLVIKCVIKH